MISYFIPGLAAGLILGKEETEVSHYPTIYRYALFITKTEGEALEKLTKIYSELGLQKPVRFDEDGNLEVLVEQHLKKGKTVSTSRITNTISISRYPLEQLLKVEMFDIYMNPYGSEIMIARHLMQENGK